MLGSVVDRHERIVLQCSGGRDSMSTLYLMRPWWDRLTVFWCNTGAQYDETIAVMAKVREMVPHFVEVTTDQPASRGRNGHPSAVVPGAHTGGGKILSGELGITIRSTWECCSENIWTPLHTATIEFGATLVIRGQRDDDRYRAPLRSGDVIDGIEYLLPVQEWTRAQCDAYLAAEASFDVPAHYSLDHSSLDCWSCTCARPIPNGSSGTSSWLARLPTASKTSSSRCGESLR